MNIEPIDCRAGKIDGVEVRDLEVNFDDRGVLFEALRTDWNEISYALNCDQNKGHKHINQVYVVMNTCDAIRAYHKHDKLIDFFTILNNSAKFVLIDDRKESPTFQKYQVVNMVGMKPQVLVVPAGVYHGWKAPTGTILLSSANQLYKGVGKVQPIDEERISHDILKSWVDVWSVQFK